MDALHKLLLTCGIVATVLGCVGYGIGYDKAGTMVETYYRCIIDIAGGQSKPTEEQVLICKYKAGA